MKEREETKQKVKAKTKFLVTDRVFWNRWLYPINTHDIWMTAMVELREYPDHDYDILDEVTKELASELNAQQRGDECGTGADMCISSVICTAIIVIVGTIFTLVISLFR